MKKEQVDLAVVVGHAVDASKDSIDAAGLGLVVDLPGEPLMLDGEPARLAQAFANLLHNAAKCVDRGGRVEVAARRQGDTAVVSVAGASARGLASVKSLVERHGGTVEARSEGEGRGGRITVRLPLSRAAREDSARQGAPCAAESSPRVLVVDDTFDVADSIALLLQTLGAEVRVAYSGAEGLTTCVEFEPRLVLLDIGMPEMDGFETARRMRELPAGREATLVALTGWGEGQTRRRVEEAGFDRHLTKPADINELEALLDAARKNDD